VALPCQPGMFLLTSEEPGLAGLLAFCFELIDNWDLFSSSVTVSVYILQVSNLVTSVFFTALKHLSLQNYVGVYPEKFYITFLQCIAWQLKWWKSCKYFISAEKNEKKVDIRVSGTAYM